MGEKMTRKIVINKDLRSMHLSKVPAVVCIDWRLLVGIHTGSNENG